MWEEAVKCGLELMEKQDRGEEAIRIYEIIQTGDMKKALLVSSIMLIADANNFSAIYSMGTVLLTEEKYDEALKYYVKAAQIDPNNTCVLDDMGLAYLELNRHDEALKCYEKSLQLDHFKHGIWYNKALALAGLGRKEEALKSYEIALDLDPEFSDAWFNKGELLYEMGKMEEAFFCRSREIETRKADR